MAGEKKGGSTEPRVTVTFAAAKRKSKNNTGGGNARYIYVKKSVAEKLGMKIEKAAGVKNKKGQTIAVRGSSGAGSIKIPMKEGDKTKYLSVPVPANATINC